MKDDPGSLEIFWEQLLSRESSLIIKAFQPLRVEEKQAVLAHLHRMANEPGWHPEQRQSAQAALDALQENDGT